MALKDWKKVGENEWERLDKSKLLMVYTGYAYHGKYWLRVFYRNKKIGINNPDDIKGLHSKSVVLKKAKNYMRNH